MHFVDYATKRIYTPELCAAWGYFGIFTSDPQICDLVNGMEEKNLRPKL